MPDLIQLIFENGEVVHCTSLDDAKSKAIVGVEGKTIVEIFPEGSGGLVTTLEFDRNTQGWMPA